MLNTLLRYSSFGKRYFLASIVYLGLALILAGMEPRLSIALAAGSCDGESPCQSGEQCCNGTCIPDTDICCGDGTHGDSASCGCCYNCDGCATTLKCP